MRVIDLFFWRVGWECDVLGGFKFEYFVEFLRIFMAVTVALSVE